MTSQLESLIASVAQKVGPAVVGVGRRSGVVVAPGHVLTAAHAVRCEQPEIHFSGGSRRHGETVAVDLGLDLALVSVDTDDVEPLPWPAEEKHVGVGTAVLALANPGGRGLRVTPGFVSCATARPRSAWGRRFGPAIEHTAPLPRGSSGSPLLDRAGALIAVNAIRIEFGLILAIPVDRDTRRRLESARQGRQTRPVRLGVAIAPTRVARRLRGAVGLPDREGVLVREVEESSPAADAGLQRGDLIVTVAGHPVTEIEDLYAALEVINPGDALALGVVRGVEDIALSASF